MKAFIVTTEFEKDCVTPKLDKNGEVKRSLRAPSEDDWALRKKRTEKQLENSGQTVGCFIYDHLLAEPSDKIRGNFVRTIERKYYKDELRAILRKQMEFHPALCDDGMLRACIAELYQKNEAHRKSLLQKDMEYLLVDDLLFYQRPLKRNRSLLIVLTNGIYTSGPIKRREKSRKIRFCLSNVLPSRILIFRSSDCGNSFTTCASSDVRIRWR